MYAGCSPRFLSVRPPDIEQRVDSVTVEGRSPSRPLEAEFASSVGHDFDMSPPALEDAFSASGETSIRPASAHGKESKPEKGKRLDDRIHADRSRV